MIFAICEEADKVVLKVIAEINYQPAK